MINRGLDVYRNVRDFNNLTMRYSARRLCFEDQHVFLNRERDEVVLFDFQLFSLASFLRSRTVINCITFGPA